MNQAEQQSGRHRQRALILGLVAATVIWLVITVVWPRLSLGPPVARQVAMSRVPLDADDTARCRTGVVSSWYDDRVHYYARTGCEGLDVDAVTVTVEGPDGHRDSFTCGADQSLLGCRVREVEGTLHCGQRCEDAVLTLTHRIRLPAGTAAPTLGSASCAVDGVLVTCSYQVTMATISITDVWSSAGDEYACLTRPVGQRRIPLGAVGDTRPDSVLVPTPAGTAMLEATADAVRRVLGATGGIPHVAETDVPGQCRERGSSGAPGR